MIRREEKKVTGFRPYRVIKFTNSVTPKPSYGDLHFFEPNAKDKIHLGYSEEYFIFDLKGEDAAYRHENTEPFDVLEGVGNKFRFLLASMCGAYQGRDNFDIICDVLEEHMPEFKRTQLSKPIKPGYYEDDPDAEDCPIEFVDSDFSPFGYVEYHSANVCRDALIALSPTGDWKDGVWEFLTNENILVVGAAYSIMGRDCWRQFAAYLPENSFEYLA